MNKLIQALAAAPWVARVIVLGLGLLSLPAWSAVSLSSPANNALYLAPLAATAVRANASASGGATVVRVEFYANGNLINTDATSPYQFDWTNVAAGTYTLTARSVDSNAVETTSSPRTITVAASNTPPTVSLTAPANNASYITPSSVTATATAAGPELNDLLQRVEFYLNGNLAATITQAPYTTSFTSLADGTYALTAVAVDGQGAQTTSAARSFTIGQNQPPTVSITTPLDNSKWHSPAGFPFQVSAAAPETNDTLTVEFYANGSLIGTRTSSPWSINTSGMTAGTYVLTAKAIDGQGANTTSAPRTIVVSDTNNAPIVSITAPTTNANFPAPAPSITINATATAGEVNGWITRVEFYVNGVLTNTDTAGPFTFNLSNVAAGGYAITAKAVDQLNAETISAPINITVGAASIFFVHTDHLNTPRLITNNVGQAVWQWNNDDPFGNNAANEDPSALGAFTCNLRLPGQYFDKETGLAQNWRRDYWAEGGRYWQSDPIGLMGGINTYGYAQGNPLINIDPTGEIVPVLFVFLGGTGTVAAATTKLLVASMAIGGAVGAITGAVQEAQKGGWCKENAIQIASSAFLGGGIGILTGHIGARLGLVAGSFVGGAAGFLGDTLNQLRSGDAFNGRQGAFQGTVGFLSGMSALPAYGPLPVRATAAVAATLSGASSLGLNAIYGTDLGGFRTPDLPR